MLLSIELIGERYEAQGYLTVIAMPLELMRVGEMRVDCCHNHKILEMDTASGPRLEAYLSKPWNCGAHAASSDPFAFYIDATCQHVLRHCFLT